MKTLQNIFNYITLFSYALFLGLIFSVIINIAIKLDPTHYNRWEILFIRLIFLILSYKIYMKTYKYLIQ